METVLLVAAILVAGLACPAMMWWQRRRGREAACCAPAGESRNPPAELEELRRGNAVLSARLAQLRGGSVAPASPRGRGGEADR